MFETVQPSPAEPLLAVNKTVFIVGFTGLCQVLHFYSSHQVLYGLGMTLSCLYFKALILLAIQVGFLSPFPVRFLLFCDPKSAK